MEDKREIIEKKQEPCCCEKSNAADVSGECCAENKSAGSCCAHSSDGSHSEDFEKCCHAEHSGSDTECCKESENKECREAKHGDGVNEPDKTACNCSRENESGKIVMPESPYQSCCSTGEGRNEKAKKIEMSSSPYQTCCSTGAHKDNVKAAKAFSENPYKTCCSSENVKNVKRLKHCSDCADGSEGSGCSCCDLTQSYLPEEKKSKRLDKGSIKQIVKLSVSLVFLIIGFFNWHEISGGRGFFMAFYYVNPAWVAVILCGIPIFVAAFNSLRRKKLTASVLISIAMLASIALEITGFVVNMDDHGHGHSYVFAAGEIAFLMALGELLEEITVKKCRSGIQRLVNLIPTEANVLREGGVIERLTLDAVNIGDTVLVKSGEMVPVDGRVLNGNASIDQSSLTGEYLPVDVSAGDGVFGGTMNKNGVIEVEVTKLQKDMTIAKMAELTIEAEGKKSPISRTADKVASYIVPFVFVVSLLVGLLTGLVFKVGTLDAVIRSITVLVVFCPCSLVLATPTAIAAGLGNAARNGVLVKSGESLEELSRVDTVCFDKTGTITEGNIELQDIIPYGIDAEELLKIAASAEKYSEHPLALAVLAKAEKGTLYEAKDIRTMTGIGITASINGSEVSVTSYKKALENGVDLAALEKHADNALSVGKTVAVVTSDNKAIGLLAFSDTIRPNAKEVIGEMGRRGYKTVMLTGDNGKSAAYIAEQCGISEVRHSLMPEDKLNEIEKMQNSERKVAMIGDGINDAPSLKLADCSFAMGAMGSDIAIDTADMAILNSDLNKVNGMLRLSKRVMRTIIRNIVFAMTVSVVAMVLSAFAILDPVTGALVHNCTSVFVVASSALVLYNRKKKSGSEKIA